MAPIDPKLVPPSGDDRVTITCLHCEKPQEVSRRAMSITCKFCHKALKLEDLPFTRYEARRVIETCGTIVIEKKANVIADKILCGHGMVIRGKVKGMIVSRGPVLIGPEADVKGDVTAPSLAVGAGALLNGRYEIGARKAAPPREQDR
jgi:hypothetical protein